MNQFVTGLLFVDSKLYVKRNKVIEKNVHLVN